MAHMAGGMEKTKVHIEVGTLNLDVTKANLEVVMVSWVSNAIQCHLVV
jgi:hypothetical protein